MIIIMKKVTYGVKNRYQLIVSAAMTILVLSGCNAQQNNIYNGKGLADNAKNRLVKGCSDGEY